MALRNHRHPLPRFRIFVGDEWRYNEQGTALAFNDQVETAMWVLEDFGNFVFYSRQRKLDQRLKVDRKNETISLDLGQIQITDERLKRLYGLVNLKKLGLSDTQITDAGLKHLSGLVGLTHINLIRTLIKGRGLRWLCGLVNLKELNLSDTQITNAGLKHLSGLVRLTHLNLTHTKITDAGLKHLRGLVGLTHLNLDRTQIKGRGLAYLSGAVNLESLYLDDTQITSELIYNLFVANKNRNHLYVHMLGKRYAWYNAPDKYKDRVEGENPGR